MQGLGNNKNYSELKVIKYCIIPKLGQVDYKFCCPIVTEKLQQ